MMNLEELAWDKGALEITGISESKLPRLVPTTEIFFLIAALKLRRI